MRRSGAGPGGQAQARNKRPGQGSGKVERSRSGAPGASAASGRKKQGSNLEAHPGSC